MCIECTSGEPSDVPPALPSCLPPLFSRALSRCLSTNTCAMGSIVLTPEGTDDRKDEPLRENNKSMKESALQNSMIRHLKQRLSFRWTGTSRGSGCWFLYLSLSLPLSLPLSPSLARSLSLSSAVPLTGLALGAGEAPSGKEEVHPPLCFLSRRGDVTSRDCARGRVMALLHYSSPARRATRKWCGCYWPTPRRT